MNLLETKGLSKHYGSVVALEGLDLSLERGEPIALIGPNGAGKTTLLSLLCGYIKPTKGQASVLGCAPGSRDLVGQLAALPQDAHLDPRFSVQMQLRLFARLQGFSGHDAKAEVERVLGIVQLSNTAQKKPSELSHGMRKRIALAQTLIGQPKLILLDEPTAGIDPPNVKIIRDLIRIESENATFIISSHNLDELEKLCTHVVYLYEGQLKQSTTLDSSTDAGYLTLGAPEVEEEALKQAILALSGVLDVQRQTQGNYLIHYGVEHNVDQMLLALLAQHGWHYRHLINGRSLEDRLYG